jgi:alkylation response protein AidB-like acyl-CoA dehydrogenase
VPVLSRAGRPPWAAELIAAAQAAAGEWGCSATAALALAATYGRRLPLPGRGGTAVRWRLLAEVAAVDLTVARVLEAHADALAILAEAGQPLPDGTWGVFAAEAPDASLVATPTGDGVRLTGTKPWCSLAGSLDSALVTADVAGGRGLYAADLHHRSVTVDPPQRWVARGLTAVPSAPVHFAGTPARAVGETGWYLTRPGFAWGGLGVAACWLGGACALAAALRAAAVSRTGPDAAIYAMHLGGVDVALHAAATCLDDAARRIDEEQVSGDAAALLALRVRSVLARTAEETAERVGHALGPAPLAFDEQHARRVADLQLYVRQHHAERDLAALGRGLLAGGAS